MDTQLLIVLSVIVSSYIVFGLLFFYAIRSSSSTPEQRYSNLKSVVSSASMSVEHRHPSLHPKEKKAQITQLAMLMLKEMQYAESSPFTIDALIDEAMLQADTDPRLQMIRFSSETTRQITPPAGMMSLGMRYKSMQRTGKLVN